ARVPHNRTTHNLGSRILTDQSTFTWQSSSNSFHLIAGLLLFSALQSERIWVRSLQSW
ncbi:unnamed protein product, partial [Linum tenue]